MIAGKKINLRALESGDGESYHIWINDSESNATRGLYHPQSKQNSDQWISTQMERDSNSNYLTLVIETAEGKAIGFIGLRSICFRSQRAELWIYIGNKSEWKKGYGFDAVETLCNYGFDSMNLHRIWLECDPEYERIMAMYISVGFALEGRLKDAYFRHGSFRDTCILGYLRSTRKKGNSEI